VDAGALTVGALFETGGVVEDGGEDAGGSIGGGGDDASARGIFFVSGSFPMSPRMTAVSVPCPLPVAASDP